MSPPQTALFSRHCLHLLGSPSLASLSPGSLPSHSLALTPRLLRSPVIYFSVHACLEDYLRGHVLPLSASLTLSLCLSSGLPPSPSLSWSPPLSCLPLFQFPSFALPLLVSPSLPPSLLASLPASFLYCPSRSPPPLSRPPRLSLPPRSLVLALPGSSGHQLFISAFMLASKIIFEDAFSTAPIGLTRSLSSGLPPSPSLSPLPSPYLISLPLPPPSLLASLLRPPSCYDYANDSRGHMTYWLSHGRLRVVLVISHTIVGLSQQ